MKIAVVCGTICHLTEDEYKEAVEIGKIRLNTTNNNYLKGVLIDWIKKAEDSESMNRRIAVRKAMYV